MRYVLEQFISSNLSQFRYKQVHNCVIFEHILRLSSFSGLLAGSEAWISGVDQWYGSVVWVRCLVHKLDEKLGHGRFFSTSGESFNQRTKQGDSTG